MRRYRWFSTDVSGVGRLSPARLVVVLLAVLVLAGCTAPPPQPAAAPAAEPIATSTNAPTSAPTTPPAPTPIPTTSPTPSPPTNELAALEAAHRPPSDRVALARLLGGQSDAATVARTSPLEVQVGDQHTFWVTNMSSRENYEVAAELRYAGPVVLMYVEEGFAVEQAALETAARTFERDIYPRTRALFGSEWQPGVDGDPRITILHTRNNGDNAIGYFSARDSLPRTVNRFSNEREKFTMKVSPEQSVYLSVLAHEFQHMIHWNEQRGSATWFNEGCATLSQDLNGYASNAFVNIYLSNPDTQLTAWHHPPTAASHYGAANLFMRYIYHHYAGAEGLAPLLREDAGDNLAAFVALAARTRPDIDSFARLFGDWAVANVVNDPTVADGRYAYPDPSRPDETDAAAAEPFTYLPRPVLARTSNPPGTEGRVNQFGVDYLALPTGPLTLTVQGDSEIGITSTAPHDSYAWWSGRSDNSIATLTRRFDLRDLSAATLSFDLWYELERDYDYAFVSVSTDDGQTWQTLPGRYTTDDDPQGANYGHGWTGTSGTGTGATSDTSAGAWVAEEVDLSRYVGQEVLVRFWQLNDEAMHRPGLLLDNIRLCEGETSNTCPFTDTVEDGPNGWQGEGFVRVDGDLAQQWEIRLVRTAADGSTTVERLPTDESGQAQARLAEGETAILVIAAVTPHTTEPAAYHLALE